MRGKHLVEYFNEYFDLKVQHLFKELVVYACRELQEIIAMFNDAMSKRSGGGECALVVYHQKKVTMSVLIQLSELYSVVLYKGIPF